MSGIKTINSANPGLKRPFRLSDLQNVWDGLTEALASETLNSATPIKIVSGLHIIGGILTPGVIAYKGKLYYYEGVTSDNGGFSEGNDMYVATIDDDDRTLSTGLVQPFYINNVIRNSKVNSGAIRILTNVTEFALSLFRYIPYVNGGAIVNNTINKEKLVSGSVTTDKIAGEAVTTDKIADAAISEDEIADSAVTTPKLAYALRPCVLSSLTYDYTATSTALLVSLPDLITNPGVTASGLWEMKTAKVTYNGASSPLVVTIRAYNLASPFLDYWPAVLPLMLSYSSDTVTTVDVRIQYPLPFANQAGLRYSKTYTVNSGDTIQFMLTKVPSKLGYVPTSVIFNE